MSKNLSLNAGIVVERVGGELLVGLPGHTDVVKLTGSPADVVLAIQEGTFVDSQDKESLMSDDHNLRAHAERASEASGKP